MNKIIEVNFANNGGYKSEQWNTMESFYYYVPPEIEVNKDDRVYIQNSFKEALALVINVIEYDEITYSYIVKNNKVRTPRRLVKIDISKFLEQEAKVDKINKLRAEMDERVKALSRYKMYEQMCEYDESFRPIYEEYLGLERELKGHIQLPASESKSN